MTKKKRYSKPVWVMDKEGMWIDQKDGSKAYGLDNALKKTFDDTGIRTFIIHKEVVFLYLEDGTAYTGDQ
tara:strand:- start:414 stop:623 length:210 start_codon:yes stop_codon:yes gene_type:complete